MSGIMLRTNFLAIGSESPAASWYQVRFRMPVWWPCGCHPIHVDRCSHDVLDHNITIYSILFDVHVNQDLEQRSPAPCLWQAALREMQEAIRDDGGIAFRGKVDYKSNQDFREQGSMCVEGDRSPFISDCVCLDPLPYERCLDQRS